MSPPSTSGSTTSVTSCRASVTPAIDNSGGRNGGVKLCSRVMAPLRPSRASILVIDDDPAITRTLMDALELADYRVWHAINGAEARGQMQRAGLSPDLVLLDVMLPDSDGLVLCRLLKSGSDVPIIICSGSPRRADPGRAPKLAPDCVGCNAC